MTFLRSDQTSQQQKGIQSSNFPDLSKLFPPALATDKDKDSPMAAFFKLDDSPMFQKQVRYLEQTTDELKNRCQKLHKGAKKYMDSLGEACNTDLVFLESLEAFGGGQDDPVSVSIGGPIMSKFVTAFRELETFKELLHSQVEHMLVDRLTQFLSFDLQDTKDSRKRFDKATHSYDQAREKVASLKKSTRDEVVAELEEDLHNSKSAFERSRFNLVNSLMNVEAKKKYEFLESLGALMDAHLRYFKLGYDLLSQMEPFIHQVLTYAQQSKEQASVEQDRLAKRIQEFRTQAEMKQLPVSGNLGASTTHVSKNGVGMSSDKNIEAIMQSSAKGMVQTIKQGYLLKRSSSLRADWKRRFFVLDSHGNLYYHRTSGNKPAITQSYNSINSAEPHSRVFGRFRSKLNRASLNLEENPGCHTVDLRTSTIKIDAEDTDLRLCFRIISPLKTYTLQAENEADRIDWMSKITGVIASLLNSHLQLTHLSRNDLGNNGEAVGDISTVSQDDNNECTADIMKVNPEDSVSSVLRGIPGNDLCAECSAPEPDWASLNLGILVCIECSGVHRNLGVHISKVRSITLDVKVWEPTVLDLFRTLGNEYCNSIWENLLQTSSKDGTSILSAKKPSPGDAIQQREKYIAGKYVEKWLVCQEETTASTPSYTTRIWGVVKSNNIREVYRLIVISNTNITNTTYDEAAGVDLFHNAPEHDLCKDSGPVEKSDPVDCEKLKNSSKPESCLRGCTLVHLACHSGYQVMLELLLQFGGDINRCDYHGRTPLHHCICSGNNKLAKYILRRGASASIKDGGGQGALERAMEMGSITDDDLLILLSEGK